MGTNLKFTVANSSASTTFDLTDPSINPSAAPQSTPRQGGFTLRNRINFTNVAAANKKLFNMVSSGSAAQVGLGQLGARAEQAGAFGGSRHGIAEAELMKGYTQQAMDQAARLRQQGFQTALGASQADLSRQLGAAGQLAGLGGQSFGYGQAIQQQQMQQGAMQQQMMQNLINAARQQYAGYAGQPQQALSTFAGGVSGMPTMSGGSKSYQPGVLDYMMAAGQFAPS
jgi:hypothetical protein